MYLKKSTAEADTTSNSTNFNPVKDTKWMKDQAE